MLVQSPIFQGQLIERILSLTFLVLMLGGLEKNAKSRSEKCRKNAKRKLFFAFDKYQDMTQFLHLTCNLFKKRQDKFSTVVDTNKSRVQFHL